ncbi:FUSC family protein [Actinomadura sediminis]|uniref:Aromatic acid exporter family protein n=1 Tax=Actinomadura sediminis TaxID=1038904 RepID=A0ABW3EIY6_9ACTN
MGERVRRLAPRTDRRSWEDRVKITVKGVVAGVGAWLVAKYLVGHAVPYFAPLAALLGVYPTVARSVRESIGYAAGFLVGAGLAIPVGLFIGPNTAGIAVVLVVGLMLSSWRGFGSQSSQVAFTALFALLVGGDQVVAYVHPRLYDVAVGLAFGLVVNVLLFPPLYLRRAEYAVRQVRDVLAESFEELADGVADQREDWRTRWDDAQPRLGYVVRQARFAVDQGWESLRGNPRARLWGFRLSPRMADQWGTPRQMTTLEHAAADLHWIAGTLREATDGESGELRLSRTFRADYAGLLRALAEVVRCESGESVEVADEARSRARELQDGLERPFEDGTDVPGIWDPRKELLRLSGLALDALSP